MRLWRRLGFRGQLMVLIAAIMVLGGGLLLAVQYVVLSVQLSNAATVQNGQAAAGGEVSGDVSSAAGEPSIEVTRQSPTWMQSDPVVSSVLGGVQMWSIVLLIVFVGIAIFGAWVLSRGASRRIAAVTSAANAITEDDLSQRMQLAGPDDEIRELGAAINAMLERVEGAFHRQEAFIANASHEFRTPLATVRTMLQVAVRQQRVPAELLPDVQDVLDVNRRLESLVATLLTIAQGRARTDLPLTEFDLAALVAESFSEHEPLASGHGIACTYAEPKDPVIVSGNRPLLRSLVGNLLMNAIRHNHAGGFLTVELAATSEEATITIGNSGDVIAPELAAELTAPFQRGERSRTRNADGSEAGIGLGLTLAESILQIHGGALVIEPRETGGLIVRATIPLRQVIPG